MPPGSGADGGRVREATADEAAPSTAADEPATELGSGEGESDEDAAGGIGPRMSRMLDAGHAAVSSTVESVADGIDGFFQDQRIDEGYNESRVRVRFGPRIAEGGRSKFKADGRADLRLPAMSRKATLVLAGLTDRDERDPNEPLDPDDNLVTAFRLFLLQRTGAEVNVDAGLRWRPMPDPIVRLRGAWSFPVGDTLLRPTQFFYWKLDDGLGETTRLDVDRRFWRNGLGRIRTDVTYSEESSGVEIDASINYFQRLTGLSGYSVRLLAEGHTEPAWVVTRYEVSARYRRAIHDDWLFIDLGPAIEFRRSRDWAFSPGITILFEVLFGAEYVDAR